MSETTVYERLDIFRSHLQCHLHADDEEHKLYSPRQGDESRLKTLVLSLRHEVGEHDSDDRYGPHGSGIEERHEIVHAEVCRYLIV